MRSLAYVVGLTAIWVMLWGSASPANVLSGLAVSYLLVAVLPGLRRHRRWGRVRLGPLLGLVGHMLVSAITSNAALTRDIVARRSRLHTGVVGVRLPDCSDELITLITNLLALTPGTMPVELVEAPRTIYVHVLRMGDGDGVRRRIRHLTSLAVRAFGSDADVRALRRVVPAAGGTSSGGTAWSRSSTSCWRRPVSCSATARSGGRRSRRG
jgi:multicomponent Na+:H+ antiporter subunit E